MPNVIVPFISVALISYVNAHSGNNSSATLLRRKCFVVAESSIHSMVNKPMPMKCPGFMCWDSQLTVLSKAKITRMYNKFRNKKAQSEKLNSAIRMKWHWSLEDEALKLIASCPSEKLHEYNSLRNIEGLDNSLTCEYRAASISLVKSSQENFLRYFRQFLETNAMLDSDEHRKFRRASVMHFGCALTISNSTNGSRFICVYCSKEKSLRYVQENCTKYTTRNRIASEFPYLCDASEYIDLYGCEPKRPCSSAQPEFWKTFSPGELEKYHVVTSGRDVWLVINRTTYEIQGTEVNEKSDVIVAEPSRDSWFLNYSTLSEYSYDDDETVQSLEETSSWRFADDKKRLKRELNKNTKLSQYQGIEPDHDYYPYCCICLFVLNLVLFIGLTVLVSFTVRHYKNQKIGK